MKPTKRLLTKIEDIFAETEYALRYEKGNFKSGYCILKDTRIVIINKYYSLEGKINALTDILRQLSGDINVENLSEQNQELYHSLLK